MTPIAICQRMRNRPVWRLLALVLAFGIGLLPAPAQAQDGGQVQEFTGEIVPGELYYYRLPDLQAGETLYVYVDELSGNLDPITGVLEGDVDFEVLEQQYRSDLADAIASGVEPLEAVREVQSRYFLSSNDDGGPGLAAALAYDNPGRRRLRSHRCRRIGYAWTPAPPASTDCLSASTPPTCWRAPPSPTGDVIAALDLNATPHGAKSRGDNGRHLSRPARGGLRVGRCPNRRYPVRLR